MPALARAREAQLVEEMSPSLFSFRHALTREAIYNEYLGAQVRPLHRTIALSLESEPAESGSLESLAYHWWAADGGERAAHYNELAGDAAGSVHAHEDAIAFYERALEAPAVEIRSRGRILEKIADHFTALGLIDRAHDRYGAAAVQFALGVDDERQAHCRTRDADTRISRGAAFTSVSPGLPRRSRIRPQLRGISRKSTHALSRWANCRCGIIIFQPGTR